MWWVCICSLTSSLCCSGDSGRSDSEDEHLELLSRQLSVGGEIDGRGAGVRGAEGGSGKKHHRGWKRSKNLSFKLRRARSHDAITVSQTLSEAPPPSTRPPYM